MSRATRKNGRLGQADAAAAFSPKVVDQLAYASGTTYAAGSRVSYLGQLFTNQLGSVGVPPTDTATSTTWRFDGWGVAAASAAKAFGWAIVTDPAYGAVAATVIPDAATTATSTTISSPGGYFTSSMNGQYFLIPSAGPQLNTGGTAPWAAGPLVGTFTYVSATSGTVSVAASQTVAGASMSVGPDSASAINAALAAKSTTWIPESTDLFIASEISLGSNQTLRGASWLSRIIAPVAKSNAITSYAATKAAVYSLTLIGSGSGSQPANTTPVSGAPNWANSGSGIIFARNNLSKIEDVQVLNFGADGSDSNHNGVAGIWLTYGCTNCTVRDATVTYCRNGINEDNFFNSTVTPAPISNRYEDCTVTYCRFGYAYQSGPLGKYAYTVGCYAGYCMYSGFDINAQNYATFIGNTAEHNGFGSGSQNLEPGFVVYSTGSQTSAAVHLIGNFTFANATHGYKISDNCVDWKLLKNQSHSNGEHGYFITNGSVVSTPVVMHGEIDGNHATGNGIQNNTGFDAFHITSCSYIKVGGNVAIDRQGTPSQAYGLRTDGTADYIDISAGNDFTGYAVGSANSTASPRLLAGSNNIYSPRGREGLLRGAQSIAWEPFSRDVGKSAAPASGDLRGVLVGLFAGETITNIHAHVSVLGSGLTLSKVAVLNSSGKILAVSADISSSLTSVGEKVLALTSPYSVLTDGAYFFALLQVGATPATIIVGTTGITGYTGSAASGPSSSVNVASQTDVTVGSTPSLTASGTCPWLAYN
jgi:hypothetical protein